MAAPRQPGADAQITGVSAKSRATIAIRCRSQRAIVESWWHVASGFVRYLRESALGAGLAGIDREFRAIAETEGVKGIGAGRGIGQLEDMAEIGAQQPVEAGRLGRQPGGAADDRFLAVEGGGVGCFLAGIGDGYQIIVALREQADALAARCSGDIAGDVDRCGPLQEDQVG